VLLIGGGALRVLDRIADLDPSDLEGAGAVKRECSASLRPDQLQALYLDRLQHHQVFHALLAAGIGALYVATALDALPAAG
jgi:hypothetical protein